MKKIIHFWLIAVFSFLVASGLISISIKKINYYRNREYSRLTEEAIKEQNPRKKIILFAKAELLKPSAENKTKLAQLYTEIGDLKSAYQLLDKTCPQKLSACDYLSQLGKFDLLKNNLKNLPPEYQQEFAIAQKIYQGNFDLIQNITNTKSTETLRFLNAIKDKNTDALCKMDLIDSGLRKIACSPENRNTKIVRIANRLNATEIPSLALLILNDLNWYHKEIYKIKAESYAKMHQAEKAYNEILKAIERDPSDMKLYEEAFFLAENINAPSNFDLLQDNYEKLKRLSQ